MVKLLLNGCLGKMGQAVEACVNSRDDVMISCGVDLAEGNKTYPVYNCFVDVEETPDIIIDFSNPLVLDDMLSFAVSKNIPVIICTTGFSEEQVKKIKDTAKDIPVFYSGNMSLGINVLIALSKMAARVLSDSFDIEIVEKHHNQKIDAPSGTALKPMAKPGPFRKKVTLYTNDPSAPVVEIPIGEVFMERGGQGKHQQ